MLPFAGGLGPAGVVGARRVDETLYVRLDEAKPDISVELLPALIKHQAGAAFDPHLVGVLIIRGQGGKGGAAVNAVFNGTNIDAEIRRYLALHVPTGNVATIFEERATERPRQ